MVPVRCGKIAVVGSDEAIHVIRASLLELSSVHLDQQGVSHAVLPRAERRPFLQAPLYHPGPVGVGGPQLCALTQQVSDLPKVLWGHGVHQRDVLLGFLQPDMLMLLTGEFVQLSAQLPQPGQYALGDRGLRARAVVFELFDDQGRDQQFKLALVQEHPQRNDPLLAIPAHGQIQPGRGVDQ